MAKVRLTLNGIVVRSSTADTAVVEVTTWKVHRLFRKRYKKQRRYLVHDPGNLARLGGTVKITPCRPISRRKHWKILSAPTIKQKPSATKPKSVKSAPKREKVEEKVRTNVATKIVPKSR